MEPTALSALAALAGSAVGGMTSLAASWLSQAKQTRAQQRAHSIERREALYNAFIEESARLYGDAFEHETTEIANLVRLYAMISRMRVVSSPQIVEDAERIGRLILERYDAPNKTFHEMRETLESHEVDLLRKFSEACREDLRAI